VSDWFWPLVVTTIFVTLGFLIGLMIGATVGFTAGFLLMLFAAFAGP
jgi:hypothetical protein